ncbi:MAG: ABC transporter ATP-binding protein [Actinomycetota bacterium]
MIQIDGLTKRYGERTVLDQVSFTAPPGEVTAFLGANGAGKTTTMRILLGLVSATSGTATINGTRYADLPAPRRIVGALIENEGSHRGRSGRDHLRVIARAAQLPDQRVDEVLDAVELTEFAGDRTGGYSLGMRQRLGIAAAILGDPEVIVLDEPANGLDPLGIRWLRSLLSGMAAEGRTVLLSSHLLSEVEQLADRIVIIDHGRLLRDTTAEALSGTQAGDVAIRTPDPAALAKALELKGIRTTSGPESLVAHATTPAAVGDIAAATGCALHGLAAAAPDLEETFLSLTAEMN